MEETTNPTSQEAGRSVLGPVMWQEVLQLVIAPKIAVIVTRHGSEIENRQQLHRKFCEEYSVKLSYSTFSGWCEDLGITFRKRIEVSIPGWKEMPRTQPEVIRTVPVEMMEGPSIQQPKPAEFPEEPVQWDSPKPPSAMFADGLPDVLPGGMRGPAFLNQSDYAN
jgi:hypothetical protein